MYEFHGWIVLRYHTHDTNELLEDEAYNNFLKYLEEVDGKKISSEGTGCTHGPFLAYITTIQSMF